MTPPLFLRHPSWPLLAAAGSGLALTACFPNIGMAPLAWVALVPLLAAIQDQPPKRALRLGIVCGLVHYLTLLYWVVYTMATYGRLPLWLCLPVWFLLSFVLSLFTGVFGLGIGWLGRGAARLALVGPALWTAVELARTHVFTGFPWALLGASQYSQLPVLQLAEITGTYGLSWALVAGNVLVFLAGVGLRDGRPGARGRSLTLLGAGVGMFAALWVGGQARIQQIDALAAVAARLPIAVLQGNIDQDHKWDPAFQTATIATYAQLSRQAAGQGAQLVVWPETAAPFFYGYQDEPTANVQAAIVALKVSAIVGSPSLERKEQAVSYYNSAFLVDETGTIRGKYDKVHLVPFGEYVPLQRFLPFVGKMVEQVGDFSPGRQGRILDWRGRGLGILLCYEVIFPELARAMTANGAGILINMTNDAWFGRTGAPAQHFSTAVMRAVENRRSLARAANTGISGFIDPAGRIVAASNLFEQTSLTRTVPVLDMQSRYTRWGDWFAWVCVAVTAGAGIWRLDRRRRLKT